MKAAASHFAPPQGISGMQTPQHGVIARAVILQSVRHSFCSCSQIVQCAIACLAHTVRSLAVGLGGTMHSERKIVRKSISGHWCPANNSTGPEPQQSRQAWFVLVPKHRIVDQYSFIRTRAKEFLQRSHWIFKTLVLISSMAVICLRNRCEGSLFSRT